jgi:hypothetical protein
LIARSVAAAGGQLLAALAATPASARGVQAWLQLQLTGRVADGWSLASDISARSATDNRERQLLVRLQAGRALSDNVTIWLGYVRAETFNDDRRNGLEQRATGQLDWSAGSLGHFDLTLRSRAEARFFRSSGNMAWRLRQQVRLTLPISDMVEISGAAEPFVTINRNSDAPRDAIDRTDRSGDTQRRLLQRARVSLRTNVRQPHHSRDARLAVLIFSGPPSPAPPRRR